MAEDSHPPELLSLFCGAGGMDIGFDRAGFETALAYDIRPFSVASWNKNNATGQAIVKDIRQLTLDEIDEDYGDEFRPSGVIGGPPCQGFSVANKNGHALDPRNELVSHFFDVALDLHNRSALDFILMENVPAIAGSRGGDVIARQTEKLKRAGFEVQTTVLNAVDFGVAQSRRRFFLLASNSDFSKALTLPAPKSDKTYKTVKDVLHGLPDPTYFNRALSADTITHHQNHWCMTPKSSKFFDGTLTPGFKALRSFRTLDWDEPSYTASYGNREVHVHPNGKRRLSVFEAMLLQGFDPSHVLTGTLSQQITQVSEAVPPPFAEAIATNIRAQILSNQNYMASKSEVFCAAHQAR